ncbi:MAG: hypothetical protein HN383_05430 [Verrucomicrobia bacterium]|jgi:outer membrane biosynthesis protein TonB|nr:hypothetical protein [Verrucomicrobiota bacterium]MBT7699949.1 hypothetical protein [Verrucomicrobiota bacterium]
MRKWVTGTVIGLALMGVAVVFLVATTRSRQQAYAMALRQEAELEEQATKAVAMVERMRHQAARAEGHADVIGDAVIQSRSALEFVMGKGQPRDPVRRAAVAVKQPVAKPVDDGLDGSGEAPAGVMSREALERMRNRGKSPETPEAEPEPEPEAKPEPEPEPVPAPAPPAPRAVRTVRVVAKAMTTQAELGHSLLLRPPELLSRALLVEREIATTERGETATAHALEMESLGVAMEECVADLEALLPRLATLSVELEGFTLEAAQARNAAAGAVLRNTLAADRQQRVAADMARLDTLRRRNQTLLKAHAYEALARAVDQEAKQCESDPGRAAFVVAAERYRKLEWLKGYIIEQIQAKPLRWGWGLGIETIDVTGADSRGVQVKGELVRWERVSTAQYAKWGGIYAAQAGLPGRTVGAIQLGMAVFYSEHGAIEKAETLKQDALLDWDRLREEADRLLPLE